jgi:hypothetical protein
MIDAGIFPFRNGAGENLRRNKKHAQAQKYSNPFIHNIRIAALR